MGFPVMVMGRSGSGKSTSLRNFLPGEVGIINVVGKPLPFRTQLKTYRTSDYGKIRQALFQSQARSIVIDDAQYLMGFEEMDSRLAGYDKWNAIGYNFIGLVRSVYDLPDDRIVYFMQHTEVGDDMKLKAKTLGKLIDNHYTLEGLFTAVLMSDVIDHKHVFETNNDGDSTAKTPPGMFEDRYIDNDLKMVDTVMRDYWGLAPLVDADVKQDEKDKE